MITDNRKTLDEILKQTDIMEKSVVKVGVLEGAQDHKDEKGKTIPMAMIAVVMEYGSSDGKVPQRSYLRSWVSRNHGKIDGYMSKLLGSVQGGKIDAKTALKRLGVYAKGGVKARILEIQEPALKPATIKAKGSSKPLIDSSQFLNSIQSVVQENRGEHEEAAQ